MNLIGPQSAIIEHFNNDSEFYELISIDFTLTKSNYFTLTPKKVMPLLTNLKKLSQLDIQDQNKLSMTMVGILQDVLHLPTKITLNQRCSNYKWIITNKCYVQTYASDHDHSADNSSSSMPIANTSRCLKPYRWWFSNCLVYNLNVLFKVSLDTLVYSWNISLTVPLIAEWQTNNYNQDNLVDNDLLRTNQWQINHDDIVAMSLDIWQTNQRKACNQNLQLPCMWMECEHKPRWWCYQI